MGWQTDIPAGMNTANGARPVNTSPPTHAPLIAPTGSPGVNSVIDVINNTASPFQSAPPAEQGAAGWVAQGLGGVLGVIGAPQMIIDTAFASLTGPIAALFPGMPALTLGAMHVAPPHTHTHPPSLIPPAPPVPLPSLGVTLGSGAVTVLVGGLPAARAGDIGLAVTCGSLAPPFEIFTGSSNVFIGGARAARMMDLTKHCNPTSMGPFAIAMGAAGVVAGAAGGIATGNAYAAAQAAADAAVLAIKLLCGKDPGLPPGMGALVGPPVGNVLIGGFPCPPIGEMAMGGIMKMLGKGLAALRRAASRRGNGHCAEGSHPIYLPTGENFDTFVDFLSGGLFEWHRHVSSGRCKSDGPIGRGFRHWLQRSLSVRLHRAVFTDWDGVQIHFPRFEKGCDTTRGDGYVLRRLGPGRYRISYLGQPTMEFVGGEFDGELPLAKLIGDESELELLYDRAGLLTACVESRSVAPAGRRRWEFLRNAAGYIVEIAEVGVAGPGPQASVGQRVVRVAYAYSDENELVKAQDALGGIWVYEYDGFHRLTKQTDPRGYSYSFEYDVWGRCVGASGMDGLWWCRVEYFPKDKFTRYTEGENATWEYHYDDDGFVTTIVDPYGGERIRERNDDRIVCEVDSGGRELRWIYDADGCHFARIDRFGYVYPPETEMARRTDPFARALPTTPMGWHLAGLVTPNSASRAPLESWLAALPEAAQAKARELFTASPSGSGQRPPSSRYDALGRRTLESDAHGRTREYRYDACGNLLEYRDRDGQVSKTVPTSWNLVGEERDALGHGMRYRYSRIEEVIEVRDPHGNVTVYDYDLKQRLVRIRRNGKIREEYVYDDGDHFVEKLDGDGKPLLQNTIHDNHFVAKRTLASGGFHKFDYDVSGRITEASTDAHEILLGRDGAQRLLYDLRDGSGVRHRHGRAGSWRTHVLDRFELTADHRTHGRARLVGAAGGRTDLATHPTGLVRRDCSNGTVELLKYDDDGRLEARLAYRSGRAGRTSVWSVRYGFTAEGDVRVVADSARGTFRYEFDAAHRLVGEVQPDGTTHSYVLDAADNLLSKPGTQRIEVGPGNKLRLSGTETFEYDRRDHLSRRIGVDRSEQTYEYDSFDMLVGIGRRGPDGVEAAPWRATYDALGRRLSTESDGRRREFYWDGDRLAAEILPTGAVRVYEYATPDALVPLSFTEFDDIDAPAETGRTYHVFSDPVGMPLQVEDSAGAIVWWAHRVDPYGRIDVHDGAGIEYNLRWPGHYFDPETGLHYNRYRYYDPELGRYLQSDPLGYGGSQRNLYGYCPNPLRDVDVLGLAHKNSTDDADGSRRSDSSDDDGKETTPRRPTLEEKKAEMKRQATERERARVLDEAVAKADKRGARDDLSPADRAFVDASPENARLAIDPEGDGSYRVAEAQTGQAAVANGQVDGPVQRALGKVNPAEAGGDVVDGSGTVWDHKDASMGADDIAKTANTGENVMVDGKGMDQARADAMQQDIDSRTTPDAGKVIVVPR